MKNSRRDTTSISKNIASVFQALRDAGADAVVLTNKSPVINSGGDERYRDLEHMLGFSDDGAACLFIDGMAYLITDSRYEIECKERYAGVDGLKVTISKDNPEDSCYFSIARRANESRNARFVLAANESVIHSGIYARMIKGNEKIVIKDVDIFSWVCGDRPQVKSHSVDDIEDLGFPNSFNKIFSPRVSKLNAVVTSMASDEQNWFLIFSNPSDIAWILNIRCFDNPPSLMPPAIFILSQSKGYLFVQGSLGNKLVYELSNLRNNDEEKSLVKEVSVFTLDEFFTKAKYLVPIASAVYFADFAYPAQMLSIFPPEKYSCKAYDRFWFDKFKTVRTVEETESMRIAFKYDSIAFANLIIRMARGEHFGCEADVSRALLDERKKFRYFITDSFDTISAFGSNGAICHYVPDPEDSKKLTEGLLVLDFGSQYDFGTTDNTRTIAIGKPTDEEKKTYTAVLKSHIRLQMIDFPFGTDGYQLDFLARSILYEYGITVPHSIGHGIEMIGNVHASFPRLSDSSKNNVSLFKIFPGMAFTVEPGAYIEGKFGVRIENTVVSVALDDKPGFMRFEPLTLMPYDMRLVDFSMLTDAEIRFIRDYHKRIIDSIGNDIDSNDIGLFKGLF